MNRSHKVRATKQLQNGAKPKSVKAGKPYRGTNLVTQKVESTKKNAARTASSRKTSK